MPFRGPDRLRQGVALGRQVCLERKLAKTEVACHDPRGLPIQSTEDILEDFRPCVNVKMVPNISGHCASMVLDGEDLKNLSSSKMCIVAACSSGRVALEGTCDE